MENLIISTDRAKLDLNIIHGFLTGSYWAESIPEWIVRKSLDNSFCFGVYLNNKQIGFARLITDYATFAYLADVFILEEHRGKGYSKRLLDYIFNCPELRTIRRWMLATRDAHSLYSQYGFKPLNHPEIMMEITTPDFYNTVKFEEPI